MMKERAKKLAAFGIASLIAIGSLPLQPIHRVIADTTDPQKLKVSKTVTWDPEKTKDKAEIVIKSDVPKLTQNKVLFIGTLCGAHTLTAETIRTSIESIAVNADIDYYLLNKDDSTNPYAIKAYGHMDQDSEPEMTADQFNAFANNFAANGNHYAIKGFTNVLNDTIVNGINPITKAELDYDYDYIVFEFDSSRIAAGDYLADEDVLSAVAEKLQKDFYSKDKVIWINDGSDGTGNNPPAYPGMVPPDPIEWYPINRCWSNSKSTILSREKFRQLCAIFAPGYFLNESDTWKTDNYYGDGNNDFSVDESTYKLEYAVRGTTPDYLNGDAPDYLVYPDTARQLRYDDAAEIKDFLYMAIPGVTMQFDDEIKVSDELNVTNVKVSVRREDSSEWIDITDFDVSSATPTGVEGSKYVIDDSTQATITVTKGNQNQADNNTIRMSIEDVKRKLAEVKMTISVEDKEEFYKCIEKKLDENLQPVLDTDGNYVYVMNPNDGPADVTAFKDKNGTKIVGEGKGLASAPYTDPVFVYSTVENGVDDYDDKFQLGQIKDDDPLTVRTFVNDSVVLTYTPNPDYGEPEVTIDGTKITLATDGTASSKATGLEYDVKTNDNGVVTVTLPKVVQNRTVDVKFVYAAPILNVEKTIVSPTTAIVGVGEEITYEIKVTNSGKTDASGVTITDELDTSRVTFVSADNNGSYDSNTKTVTWNNISVSKSEPTVLTLKVKVNTDVAASDTISNAAQGSYKATPIPSTTPVTIKTGSVTIEYALSSDSDIPSGYNTPTPTTVVYGANNVVGAPTPSVDGYVFEGWEYKNASSTPMTFDSSKANPAVNSTNYTINDNKVIVLGKFTSIKDFTITKKAIYNGSEITDPVNSGSTVLYQIEVTNNNKFVGFTSAIIVDEVDSDLVVSNISDSGKIDNSNVITWDIPLTPGETKVLTFNATVPTSLDQQKEYENVAVLDEVDGTDVDFKGSTKFTAKPDVVTVSVTKDWTDDWANHDSETVYVGLYANGVIKTISGTASGRIELDISNPSWTGSMPKYDAAGKTITYTFKELSSATDTTGIDQDGTYNTRYKVDYDTTTTAGVTAITNAYVFDETDFTINKTAPTLAAPSDEFSYTITVTNDHKGGIANDVVFSDVLPAGVTFKSFDIKSNSKIPSSYDAEYKNGKVICSVEALEAGATVTLTITVTVDDELVAQRIENTAKIDSVGGTTAKTSKISPKTLTDVRTFKVTKVWDDPILAADSHSEITVNLYRSDDTSTPIGTAKLNASNKWTYTWTNLMLYDGDNNMYAYTVSEATVTGFEDPVISYSGDKLGNTGAKITNERREVPINYVYLGEVPTNQVTPSPDSKYYGEEYDASAKPSETGYVFAGWYTDDACTTPYVDGTALVDSVLNNGALTLYGKWTKKPEVSYQFVGDYPTGQTTPAPEKLEPGEKYDAKPTPTEKDYLFEGWFADPDCTTPYVDGTSITKDTILYGKWTPYPEVNYEFVGDTPTGQTTPAPEKVKPGTNYDAEPTPSEKGYIFDGWFADPDCTTPYVDGTPINKNTTLYGKWNKMPEVTYQYVGEVPTDVKTPDGESVDPNVGYDSADKPSKQYYEFDGWFLDPDCTQRYTDGTKIKKDTILYGNWKRLTAPVIPQPGNGEGPDPSNVVYPPKTTPYQGSTIPVPVDPTYNGGDYNFAGWFLDPDCTIPYTPTVLGPEGLNIYAKWTKKPVVYYSYVDKVPSGAILPGYDIVDPGTAYNAKNPNALSGYKFDGWYLDPQLTTKFKDGMTITGNTYLYGKWVALDPVVPTGDITHTALWIALIAVSLGGVVVIVCTSKKKKKNDQ